MSVIGLARAREIARRFLEQYNAAITIKSTYLEGTVWIVAAEIGMVNKQTRRVRIDSINGRVLGYNGIKSENVKKSNK